MLRDDIANVNARRLVETPRSDIAKSPICMRHTTEILLAVVVAGLSDSAGDTNFRGRADRLIIVSL